MDLIKLKLLNFDGPATGEGVNEYEACSHYSGFGFERNSELIVAESKGMCDEPVVPVC